MTSGVVGLGSEWQYGVWRSFMFRGQKHVLAMVDVLVCQTMHPSRFLHQVVHIVAHDVIAGQS